MADNNSNDPKIDDIVSMIDSFMSANGGHMNVTVDTKGDVTLNKKIQKTNSLECAGGNMACQVPTLHEGLDGDEN